MPGGTNASAAVKSGDKWFYMDGGAKKGPVDGYTLASMIESGQLDRDVKVWSKGIGGWAAASSTDVMDNLSARPAPVVDIGKGEKAPKKQKKRGKIAVILIIVILIALAAAVGVWYFFLRDSEAAPVLSSGKEPENVITYGIDEPTVFASDECEFIIDSVGEKGDYLELDVRCVNKTADVLKFSWDAVSINGCMFDPLWEVSVRADSTLKSSITFPLSTLDALGLLPADELRFILCIFNEEEHARFIDEFVNDDGSLMALYVPGAANDTGWDRWTYKLVKGYDDHVFHKSVKLDKDGRPYFVMEDDSAEAQAATAAEIAEGKKPTKKEMNIYFDELYDLDGTLMFEPTSEEWDYDVGFYNDELDRPYYFDEEGGTVYFEGYGFAFHDEESGKNYFYDENGDIVYYGNGGKAEKYEGKVSGEALEAGMTETLSNSNGYYLARKDYVIFPTGKSAEEIVYPERDSVNGEEVYWAGEKGTFIIRGGELDPFKGYVVSSCVENNSDNYIYFSLRDVVVNGEALGNGGYAIIRPNSRAYWSLVIPKDFMEENKIKAVQEVDFRVFAVGEGLEVPLYPIQWESPIT